MSRIDRALRRRLERREKRRSARLEAHPENSSFSQPSEIVGHGWAVHKHGHSIQWRKADVSTDVVEE